MAKEKLINCLTNERVLVRFLPKENAMAGNNPKLVLYGGMAETSTRTYTVPMLRSGQLKDVLTKDEKNFLEDYLRMEDNALSIYGDFWKGYKVTLRKEDNVLDLSDALDYIRYKVLLANTNVIAPDMQTVQDYPKATYEFVCLRESDSADAGKVRMDAKKEAYFLYGKYEKDWSTLRVIVESLTRDQVASTTKLNALVTKVDELIDRDVKTFLKVAKDPLLSTKVLIRDAIDAGVIANRGGQLYLRDAGGDIPLCEHGEPTLNVAATYLNMPKYSETRLLIEGKVNQYNENK